MEEQKEQQQQQPPSFIEQLKEYAETRIKLAKYQAVDGGTSIIAIILSRLIIIVCLLLLFVFASFTLAFYLADVLGSVWQGFGCIALFYLIVAVVLNVKKTDIQQTITNKLIDKFLN